jgi:FkbM family methyltransferase
MVSARTINRLGQIPAVRTILRWYARRYKEGSIVRVAHGHAAGMMWKRYHRYVNGYWIGSYEIELQNVLARELKTGDVFYDIGANAGFFSVLAAKLVGATGHVFAFEPLPENMKSIKEQLSINHLEHCELVGKAVSDDSGPVSLTLACNNSMARVPDMQAGQTGADEGTLMVDAITLNDFIKDNPMPSLIKIDVEGAEARVLTGADRLLNSPNPPKLLIELHGDDKARAVESCLTAYKYRFADVLGRTLDKGIAGEHHVLAFPTSTHFY